MKNNMNIMKRIALLSLSALIMGNVQCTNALEAPSVEFVEPSATEVVIVAASFVAIVGIACLINKYSGKTSSNGMVFPRERNDEFTLPKTLKKEQPAVAAPKVEAPAVKPVEQPKIVVEAPKKRSIEQINKELYDYLTSTC
jgi:hypothetical protein